MIWRVGYRFCVQSWKNEKVLELLVEKMKKEVDRSESLEKMLEDPASELNRQRLHPQKIRREINKLAPLVSLHHELNPILKNIDDLKELKTELKDPAEEELIEEEIKQLQQKKEQLRDDLIDLLIPPDFYDDVDEVTVEFRPGAGGTQSSLFVQDISNMITGYCQGQGWSVRVQNAVKQNLLNKGYKLLILKVMGQNVHKILKCESGVHKVIRVPETESKGRLHSSTISVVVMPTIPFDFVVNDKDIKYEFMRSSGPGGQSVNKTESACRATHLPSGMAVMIQEDRSQDRNKKRATEILKQRLFEIEYRKNVENEARTRKSQVGSMDRSEKIRTYNYPQDRITDHRTRLTLYGIEDMLSGNFLDQFIQAYQEKVYQEKLETLLTDLKIKTKTDQKVI